MDQLRLRATVLGRIREFFSARGVLEVETPLLCLHTVTDLHLDSIATLGDGATRYLQTSPESAMKRLLAAGSGPIYQICKAFRRGEAGALHNPEFTILEWYRPGFDLQGLIDEVRGLVEPLLGRTISLSSYGEFFQDRTGLDPHAANTEALIAAAAESVHIAPDQLVAEDETITRNRCLDLLLDGAMADDDRVLFDFPASQAAQAKTSVDAAGRSVARRFELYLGGLETANGYDELTDAGELRRRFEEDNRQRLILGKPTVDLDDRYLAAVAAGLPETSGVALGVDRLLLALSGSGGIERTLAFPWDRA